jgi:hypothetical protein
MPIQVQQFLGECAGQVGGLTNGSANPVSQPENEHRGPVHLFDLGE